MLVAVLTGLLFQDSCLKLVSSQNVPRSSLQLLAMYKSLAECHLRPSPGEDLDLQDLSMLLHLTHLTVVKGSFANLNTLAHLTQLALEEADATCSADCSSTSTLLHLDLDSSRI